MKKFSSLLVAVLVMVSFAFAQTKPVPKKQTSKVTTTKVVLKKDGTPDKRFKANKESKPAVVLKKDGTPDKRYKASKKS